MKHPRIATALALCLLGCIAVDLNVLRQTTPAVVNAEERGVTIDMRYQRGYSTWGPTNVYGTTVLWPREGVATLSVHLLPRLEGGDRYVWWVVNTKSGAALRLGTFNTTNAGDMYLDTFMPRGLPKGADAVVISMAAKEDSLATPGTARALYGVVTAQALVQASVGTSSTGIDMSKGKESSLIGGAARGGIQGVPHTLPRVLPMTGGGPALRKHQQ